MPTRAPPQAVDDRVSQSLDGTKFGTVPCSREEVGEVQTGSKVAVTCHTLYTLYYYSFVLKNKKEVKKECKNIKYE